ncbi:MAG: DeoR/GlpR transcriptional regulator, partial [Candidatus Omnitrophica bacterium]|nr:DeoR/GlpR transcriptional regulator [Candidatus Omnitrophota bacterium]
MFETIDQSARPGKRSNQLGRDSLKANNSALPGARTHNRHGEIVDHLTQAGEASVLDLARRFHVSLMTIRRDLAQLESAGKLTRTHGGAVLSKAGIVEFAFQEQGRQRAAEKCAIAKEAA